MNKPDMQQECKAKQRPKFHIQWWFPVAVEDSASSAAPSSLSAPSWCFSCTEDCQHSRFSRTDSSYNIIYINFTSPHFKLMAHTTLSEQHSTFMKMKEEILYLVVLLMASSYWLTYCHECLLDGLAYLTSVTKKKLTRRRHGTARLRFKQLQE